MKLDVTYTYTTQVLINQYDGLSATLYDYIFACIHDRVELLTSVNVTI